jgi:hypothetical protein
MVPVIVGAHMQAKEFLRLNAWANDLQLMWRVECVGVGSRMSLVYHAIMAYQPSCIMVAIQYTISVTITAENAISRPISPSSILCPVKINGP